MNKEKLYKNIIYLSSGYKYVFYSTKDIAKQMNVELNKKHKWWDVFRLRENKWTATYISVSNNESMIIPTKNIIGIHSVLTDVSDLLESEVKEGTVSLEG